MKNIRKLADKVIKTHLKNMDDKVDCYQHSQLISLMNHHAMSSGYNKIEIDKNIGIISYPYDSTKLHNNRNNIDREGFKSSKMGMPPFYYEELHLILPRDDNNHTLAILWELTKVQKIAINVEKMNLPDYFLEFMVIDKKNKTANGFRLCDIEVDFMLALQKKTRRVRVKKFFLEWIKSKFVKFALDK